MDPYAQQSQPESSDLTDMSGSIPSQNWEPITEDAQPVQEQSAPADDPVVETLLPPDSNGGETLLPPEGEPMLVF